MTIECGVLDDLRAINAIPKKIASKDCRGCGRNKLPEDCPFVKALEEIDRRAMNKILEESDDSPIAY